MEVTNDSAQDARAPQVPPKTWLVESILVTLFCCPSVFGIVGIVYASKVESLFYSGQVEAAEKASRDAGKWTKLGFWIGLGIGLIYLIIYALFFGFALMRSSPSIF